MYFVAVDSTDLKTRETGLTSFTVFRSRDGAAAVAMTTPTINETDSTNMPGVYELLLDEDMTIGSGNDTEEMAFHITQASMAPVTRTIELFRSKITIGNTLDVTATGAGGVDWGNIENKTTVNDFSGTDINLVDTTTTNTDMRGTDSALLASSAPTNFDDLAITATSGRVDININNDKAGYSISGTKTTLDALNDITTAQVNTEVDTALADINLDHLVGTSSGIPALPAGTYFDQMLDDGTATFDRNTDSLQAIRDRGDAAWTTGAGGSDRLLLVDTTIATLATQASFTLTAGSADNDAYNNCTIVIEDVATSTQKAIGMVLDYVGSSKTVTLKESLAFIIAVTDKVYILAENSLKSTVANRQLDVTAAGAAGIDWGNIENPTAIVDLSATDIQLVDTTTVNTDMRGTDSALLAASAPTNFSDLAITVTTGRVDVNINNDKAGYTLSAAGVDDIWDEPLAGHVTAGTTGKAITDIETDVAAILIDTAEIGVAGAGLTDLGGMSTAMKAEVNAEADTALTDYDAPTNAEMIARTLLAADYFDPTTDTVADVTLVATTTNVTNQVTADVTAISGDTVSADNLELQYDGTGIAGDTFPATQFQVGALSTGSAAISIQAESFTLTTGTVTSGSIADTETLNDVRHEIIDDAGVMDLFYEFDVGGDGTGVEVNIDGRINSGNDDINVFAFDFDGATFDQIGTMNGTNSSSDSNFKFNLLIRHTGTGADLGKVRIKFLATSGLTSATLRIDRLFTSFAIVTKSVGYEDGAIWIDTIKGTAGVEPFVNGTADNTVLTYADALSISATLGVERFRIINGSSITLTTDSTSFSFLGDSWFLDLNGQTMTSLTVEGANITGSGTDGGARPVFDKCIISDITIPPLVMLDCGFAGTITAGVAGDYNMENCSSTIAGLLTPKFDFGALLGDINLNLRGYSGGIELLNMGQAGTDNASIDGDFKVVLNANCVGGILVVRGNVEIIDNSGGAVTVEKIASTSRSAGYSNASLWHNASASNVLTSIFIDGTADNPVSTIAAMDTLSTALNLKTYEFVAGDDITITQSQVGKTFQGNNYELKLNNQDPPTVVQGAEMTGIANNTTTFFAEECRLGTTTTPLTINNGFVAVLCGLVDLVVGVANADIEFLDCHGNTQGSMLDSFVDLKTGATTNELAFQRWGGPITFLNIGSGDVIFMHGRGIITLDASCTGGTIFIAGNFTVVDNAGGVVSLINHGEFAQDIIADKVWDEALSSHTAAGSFGKAIADIESDATLILADTADMQPKLGTPATDISADIAALNDFNPASDAVNADRIGGSASAATRLSLSANQIIPFTVDTATFTPTSTVFEADDITEATDDHFNGRIIIWTSGALSGQATSITDYELANGKGKFTVVGMTEAPANNDTGIII